jgi:hypothetical protein
MEQVGAEALHSVEEEVHWTTVGQHWWLPRCLDDDDEEEDDGEDDC